MQLAKLCFIVTKEYSEKDLTCKTILFDIWSAILWFFIKKEKDEQTRVNSKAE